jgi:predicted alpha/beta-fold hydrolase
LDGVSLQVRINERPGAKGLAIFLPGWFDSSETDYMLSAARRFLQAGWDVIRLNPRDHGDTAHLNERMFHAARFEEIQKAVEQLCCNAFPQPVYLAGFSLGGNFALRLAVRRPPEQIPNLLGVAVISPVLDPRKVSAHLDAGPFWYRDYLMKKWKRSLCAKARAFAGRYNLAPLLRHTRIIPMTEALLPYYFDFRTEREYFDAFTLTRDSFASLAWPVTPLMAEDDPVVPIAEFHNLEGIPNLKTVFTKRGGHCGFFSNLRLDSWAESVSLETAERLLSQRQI